MFVKAEFFFHKNRKLKKKNRHLQIILFLKMYTIFMSIRFENEIQNFLYVFLLKTKTSHINTYANFL